jgi:hypothetical protein
MKAAMKGRSAASAGFSFPELMIGLFLLSLAAIAATPLFGHAMHGNAAGRGLTEAGIAVERRLEILRQQTYSSLVAGGSVITDTAGYFDRPEADLVVRWEIIDNSATIPATKILTVRAIRTRAGRGPAGQITTITLRGD